MKKILDKTFRKKEKRFLLAYYLVRGFIIKEKLKDEEKEWSKWLKDECQSEDGDCYELCKKFSRLEDELIEIEDKYCGYNGDYDYEDTKAVQISNLHDNINKIICAKLFKYAYELGKKEAFYNKVKNVFNRLFNLKTKMQK